MALNAFIWEEIILIVLFFISSPISSPFFLVLSLRELFYPEKLFTLVSNMQIPLTPVTDQLCLT